MNATLFCLVRIAGEDVFEAGYADRPASRRAGRVIRHDRRFGDRVEGRSTPFHACRLAVGGRFGRVMMSDRMSAPTSAGGFKLLAFQGELRLRGLDCSVESGETAFDLRFGHVENSVKNAVEVGDRLKPGVRHGVGTGRTIARPPPTSVSRETPITAISSRTPSARAVTVARAHPEAERGK